MENYIYRKATEQDIKFISEIRLEVLKCANNLDNNVNMEEIFENTYKYYKNNINKDNITFLVFDNMEFIGCGSICFLRLMPTYNNQIGEKAYIMNMYTREKYRRKGIAKNILKLLIEEAKNKKIKQIQLEATEIGKKLYLNYGFNELKNEMEIQI